ncbi:MAG: TIM barrel protein [Bacteroidetes bacterium]|nr:TIM barrel protein [Bacteroidota bacterium]
MNRRNFISRSVAGAAATFSFSQTMAHGDLDPSPAGQPFKHNYAPHDGMFAKSAGEDFMDQIKFMADQGFRSVEDNGMLGRSVADQEKIGKLLSQLGMTMGVFVVDGGDNWKISLTSGKQEFKDNFLKTCKQSVEVAKRVNAKWMTVVPGFYENHIPHDVQTANVIDILRRGAEIFEPHGLVMVLEPLSDTPDLFLRHSYQTFMICKAVKSPSCKILFDMYHMQRNEGNIINNINLCWDEIAYFQIGDNPGRNEPGTGEMNYRNIFKHIYDKGYRGILGMEHGNSKKDKEGEAAVIAAYRQADSF